MTDVATEDRALLALHLVPGIGPRLLGALLDRFGSAIQALSADPRQLLEIDHIGPQLAERLSVALRQGDADGELALLARHGVRLLRRGGEGYPAALSAVAGAPALLFARGDPLPEKGRAIALVGSRTCTPLGKKLAERIAGDLARAGWVIVSGLARGIDGCAHRATLEAGGKTVAVLAGGLSRIYPPEHADLAEAVARSGTLVTESCMRMEPMAGLFPARNRIISGLCRAVVIIEANEKSGALITARHAVEQGREVFVLPGPADGPSWTGNHKLLRQGARLVRNAGDILEDLEGIAPLFAATDSAQPPPGMSDEASALWQILTQPTSIDELADRTGKSVSLLASLLMQMELTGSIRRLPGNVYERSR